MNESKSESTQQTIPRLLVFTDLDGCLLNKSDYDYSAAVPTLNRLMAAKVPVILCSSKTRAEMLEIASELSLRPAPMTCENGGVISWANNAGDQYTIVGRRRSEIVTILNELKSEFAFRSFTDLGVEGVMQMTDLSEVKAKAACNRQCTEPLLWDDASDKIESFRAILGRNGLTLTEGGRFWHVAANVTKGSAMRCVLESFQTNSALTEAWTTTAIGDSPIDQSMLDIADIPIGIPQPNGEIKVRINNDRGMIALDSGAAGWAQSVGIVLDRLGI